MTTHEIIIELERLEQLESDQHLFEMFLSDHIDNQFQRMMEYSGDKSDSIPNLMGKL